MAKSRRDNNGSFQEQVLAALGAITKKLGEHDEQIAEIGAGSRKDEAVLRLVNFLYDPDDKHLPGLTRLPLRSIKAFAIQMTLDAVTSDEVRSGKVSLQQVFRNNYFFLMRSVGGVAFNKGIDLAGEQTAAEGEERGQEFRMAEQ